MQQSLQIEGLESFTSLTSRFGDHFFKTFNIFIITSDQFDKDDDQNISPNTTGQACHGLWSLSDWSQKPQDPKSKLF